MSTCHFLNDRQQIQKFKISFDNQSCLLFAGLVFINEKVCLKFVFILCGHKNFIIPGSLGSLKRHLTFIFAGDMEGISFNPFKVYSGIKFSNILPEPKTKILKENLCLCLCVISISNLTYRLDHIQPEVNLTMVCVVCK